MIDLQSLPCAMMKKQRANMVTKEILFPLDSVQRPYHCECWLIFLIERGGQPPVLSAARESNPAEVLPGFLSIRRRLPMTCAD
jgi:hypothetical protein